MRQTPVELPQNPVELHENPVVVLRKVITVFRSQLKWNLNIAKIVCQSAKNSHLEQKRPSKSRPRLSISTFQSNFGSFKRALRH